MEVRFCDLCNESVPQSDLDQGRAVVLKGRVVCATCDRAMSHSRQQVAAANAAHSAAGGGPFASSTSGPNGAPLASVSSSSPPGPMFPPEPGDPVRSTASLTASSPSGGSRSSAPMWVAVLGLLFTAGAIVAFDRRFKTLAENDRTLDQRAVGLSSRVGTLEQLPGQITESQRALQTSLRAAYSTEVDGLRRDMRELGTTVKSTRDEIARLASELQAARGESSGALTAWQSRVEEIGKRVAEREDAMRAQLERLDALEQSVKSAAEAPPAAAQGGGEGAAPADAANAGWKALLPGLTSANSGDRWSAVDTLGQLGDAEATQHLIPLLKDADVFVRMCVARVLGALNATAATPNANLAIPALIDALEDVDSPVRETAKTALWQITKRDINFDPNASDAERAKRLKAVREWWKREEETQRGGAGG